LRYRLGPEEALAAGVRRIACEQLDLAVAGLDDPKLDRDAAIHEARKCCKRLRGLLRLARAGLGEEVYQAENARLRDAARELSDLRDAEALLETYDKLGARFADEVDRRRLAPVRRALLARRRRLAEGDEALDGRVAEFRSELDAARARVASWRLAEGDFDVLAPGLKRAYGRGRKAMRAAYDAPSSERFHEWRKRVKYHRYHLDLLSELWPRPLKARRKEVKALGAMLGDEHDLAVLRATLAAEDESFADASTRALLGLATRRRAELRTAMRPLGDRIFAERPKALAARYGSYWRSWRSAAADDRWADVA
jgi:CHAD domain-containing protein